MPHTRRPSAAGPAPGVAAVSLVAVAMLTGCPSEPAGPDVDPAPAPDRAAAREEEVPVDGRRKPPAEVRGYGETLLARLRAGDAAAVAADLPGPVVANLDRWRAALAARLTDEEWAAAAAAVRHAGTVAGEKAALLAGSTVLSADDAGGDPAAFARFAVPAGRLAAGPLGRRETLAAGAVRDRLADVLAAFPADPATAWDDVSVEAEVPAEPHAHTAVLGLRTADGGGRKIPLTAVDGRWVPTALAELPPPDDATADGAAGFVRVLAAAEPPLGRMAAAHGRAAFDAAAADLGRLLADRLTPPARPVTDDERVTVTVSADIDARDLAGLLPLFAAATDRPADAVTEAVPRPDGGWTLRVGPVRDPAPFAAKLAADGAAAGLSIESRGDRTLTVGLADGP